MKYYFYSITSSICNWKSYFLFIFLCLFFGLNKAESQTNPTPYNFSKGSYSFINWPATSTAGTYPPNMYFHITTTQDPGLSVTTTGNYNGAYSGSGSIVGGLGSSGFYFYNTGTSGYLGAAVLALNTLGKTNVIVGWVAGTNTAGGGSVYVIRLQYRTDSTSLWCDTINKHVYEYISSTTGNSINFTSDTLPSNCNNQ